MPAYLRSARYIAVVKLPYLILIEVGSNSPAIPLLVAWMMRKRMLAECRPLVWYVIVSFANEIISSIAYYSHHSSYSIPFTNTYLLIFPLLLLWQYKNWNVFVYQSKLYRILQLTIVVSWIFLVVYGNMTKTGNWFRILNYVILTLVSLSNLNRIISRNTSDLIHNTNFIVTAACILVYPTKLIVDVFYLYGLDKDRSFIMQVFVVFTLINILFYLALAYALKWSDRKQPHLLIY